MMTTAPKNNTLPQDNPRDEDLGVMIYGNVKIEDLDTGKFLVNQRG